MIDYHNKNMREECYLKAYAFDKCFNYIEKRVYELMPLAHDTEKEHSFINGQYAEISFIHSFMNGIRISIEGEAEQ